MISFVVPVFKVEKYIYNCINSIINLQLSDFEIIIVNDGTPDRSIENIKDFLELSNVKLINQVNSGLSLARNSGLNLAKGKFVWFVDSDDCLLFDINFVKQIESLIKHDYDVIQIQYNLVYENSEISTVVSKHFNEVKSGIELIKEGKLHTAAQFKIYKTSFLRDENLCFFPNLLHEDVEFTYRVLPLAKSCISIEYPIYNYLQRNNGSIMSSLSIRNVNSLIIINESLINFKKNNYSLLYQIDEKYNNRICINVNMALRILYNQGIFKNINLLSNLLTNDVLNCFKNTTKLKYRLEYYIFSLIKMIIK